VWCLIHAKFLLAKTAKMEEHKMTKDAVGCGDNGAVLERAAVATNGNVWLETPSRKSPNPNYCGCHNHRMQLLPFVIEPRSRLG